ncbi:6-phosphogluconolactonase [Spirosomataceae bacterium TFI 002]|nr:6-phosphogluconolactonase [Spirosomataceae bacterium TFI 002]
MKYTLIILSLLGLWSCNSKEEETTTVEVLPSETMLIGTYTGTGSQGIYEYTFNPNDGTFAEKSIIGGVENPSFLKANKAGNTFYSVSEANKGSLISFSKDSTGSWKELNRIEGIGSSPCHINLDKSEKWIFVANYSSGDLVVLPIAADGSLGEISQRITHEGTGPNKKRQTKSHVHSVNISPDNTLLYVADLGIDKVVVYNFDQNTGQLSPKSEIMTPSGSGPRHLTFHPSKSIIYVIEELTSTISVVDISSDSSVVIQNLTTLPEGFDEESYCADIHIDKAGKYLYGSNRLHDTIALFEVQEDGTIKAKSHHSTLGSFPRNFALDPSGKYLIAANQKSDNIVIYNIDPSDGTIGPLTQQIKVPAPVCIEFIQ